MLVPSGSHAKYRSPQNAESPCNPRSSRVFNPKIAHSFPRRPEKYEQTGETFEPGAGYDEPEVKRAIKATIGSGGRNGSNRGDDTGTIRNTDPLRLVHGEIVAEAAQVCRRIMYRTDHLWSPMIAAVVHLHEMRTIGARYTDNAKARPIVGREKVRDGLVLARRVFRDLEAEGYYAERWPAYLPLEPRYALGTHGNAMPLAWQEAEHSYARAVRPFRRFDTRIPCPKHIMQTAARTFPSHRPIEIDERLALSTAAEAALG